MQRSYSEKSKLTDDNINIKKNYQISYSNPKSVVDINKLLNRVKVNENNDRKEKVIFIIFSILCICSTYFLLF